MTFVLSQNNEIVFSSNTIDKLGTTTIQYIVDAVNGRAQLERELSEKTNEVERLRESLDRYENIINKQDDELIKLRQVAVKLYGYAWDNVPDDYQSLYGILNELYEEIGPLAPAPEEPVPKKPCSVCVPEEQCWECAPSVYEN